MAQYVVQKPWELEINISLSSLFKTLDFRDKQNKFQARLTYLACQVHYDAFTWKEAYKSSSQLDRATSCWTRHQVGPKVQDLPIQETLAWKTSKLPPTLWVPYNVRYFLSVRNQNEINSDVSLCGVAVTNGLGSDQNIDRNIDQNIKSVSMWTAEN